MVALVMCICCEVGACDRCLVGHTQEGLLGGWECPCDHDPDEAAARAQEVRDFFASRFTSAIDQPLSDNIGER